jgi:uracil-DNA glycosylase
MNELNVSTDWSDVLYPLCQKHNVINTNDASIFPPQEHIFRAFSFFNMNDLKVVIIGQDPYHTKTLADGLCFSVPNGSKMPPSLRNIFKELERSYNVKRTDTDLSDWAKQGVLLINTAFTVEENKPGSHAKHWKNFTRELLTHIGQNSEHVIYMLWGNHAQSYEDCINVSRNMILKHTHPSPLSRKPFVGNNHFVLCNEYLIHNSKECIKWI